LTCSGWKGVNLSAGFVRAAEAVVSWLARDLMKVRRTWHAIVATAWEIECVTSCAGNRATSSAFTVLDEDSWRTGESNRDVKREIVWVTYPPSRLNERGPRSERHPNKRLHPPAPP